MAFLNNRIKISKTLFLTAYFLLFISVASYASYNLELYSDNLNYFVIYNGILADPYPFGVEYILGWLMWLFRHTGADFFTFTLFKQALWAPAVFLIFKNVFSFRLTLLSSLFLISFINPALHETIIFLSRQSFSLLLFIYAASLTKHPKIRSFLLISSFFTHLSSIILFVSLLKETQRLIISRLFISILLIFFFLSISNFSLDQQVLQAIAQAPFIPEYFSYNLSIKLGFHLREQGGFDPHSQIRIYMMGLFLLLMLTSLKKATNNSPNSSEHIFTSSLLISMLFFLSLSSNQILSNRLGFMAYFFLPPFIFIAVHSFTTHPKLHLTNIRTVFLNRGIRRNHLPRSPDRSR